MEEQHSALKEAALCSTIIWRATPASSNWSVRARSYEAGLPSRPTNSSLLAGRLPGVNSRLFPLLLLRVPRAEADLTEIVSLSGRDLGHIAVHRALTLLQSEDEC